MAKVPAGSSARGPVVGGDILQPVEHWSRKAAEKEQTVAPTTAAAPTPEAAASAMATAAATPSEPKQKAVVMDGERRAPAAAETPPDADKAANLRKAAPARRPEPNSGYASALPSTTIAQNEPSKPQSAAPGDPLGGFDGKDDKPLELSGIGEGGGGRGDDGVSGGQNGQGFGSGHGRLGGRHRTITPDATVTREVYNGVDGAHADIPAYRAQEIVVRIGEVGRSARRCGAAAFLPLEERVGLWRERLAAVTGNPHGVAQVYRRALAWCEAPTWRERSRLLSMLLDAVPSIPSRVSLWRIMFNDLGTADALYRGMLARVRTPADVRAMHAALGLRSIDPGVLAKMLKDAKTPSERVKKLRELADAWPDDLSLSLKLLDALEDAGDDSAARELGRKLRARPNAGAAVRIAVGELYLRIASRAKTPAEKAEGEGEARRAFGEIVEFSPEDPIARRTIGDLLRAHGWYAEASRHYETLARLTPDDAGVPLLLAAAAQGMGRLEEAVKWTEKGGASGAPEGEQSTARTARAFASTFLAWGRLEAIEAGRAAEAEALAARLARVRSTERVAADTLRGTRVTLLWAHPELHPTLWSNALGAAMPAPEGDVTLGVAAATVPDQPAAFVEVRLEPDEVDRAARLGAEAILTVVFDEGGAGEKVVKRRVVFARGGPPIQRFSLASREVKEASR